MVGLDLTHQALATPEVVARIAELGTAPARFVADLLEFFAGTYSTRRASTPRRSTTRARSPTSSTPP